MSESIAPIVFDWDGEAMHPATPKYAQDCDRVYVVGERYTLVPMEDRSGNSHRHYFGALNEAFRQLPDEYADQFPTVDALRKWCLIKSGFRDERSIVCASKAEAVRVAAFVKPLDPMAVVLVRDATVRVYTAQSQSLKAMGKDAFQRSKVAVLDLVADMLGIDAATLSANASRAA